MKRLLSVILALTMILGLAPAAFAADETVSSNGYKFKFTSDAHSGSSAVSGVCAFGDNANHTISTTVASVSDPWGYVAHSFPHNYTTNSIVGLGTEGTKYTRVSFRRPGSPEKNSGDPTLKVTFNPDSEEAVTALCFELKIAKGGEFVPSFNYYTYNVGPVVELYLVPKSNGVVTNDNLSDYVKKLDSKYRIGVVDTYGSTSALSDPFEMRSVTLADNSNYYFIMVPNGESTSAESKAKEISAYYHYFLPVSLSFAPKVASYTYDITANALDSEAVAALNDTAANAGVTYGTTFRGMTSSENDTEASQWSVANTRFVCNALTDKTDYSQVTSDGIKFLLYTCRYCDPDSGNGYFTDTTEGNETLGNCTHVAVAINIPKAGKYKISLYNKTAHSYGVYAAVYFGAVSALSISDSDVTALCTTDTMLGYHDSSVVHDGTTNSAESFNVTVPEGKEGYYALAFTTPDGTLEKNNKILNVKGEETTGSGYQTLNLSKIVLEEIADEDAAQTGDEYVNVSPDNATAETDKATISDEVSVLAKDIDGNEINNAVTKNEASVTAEKTVGDYEFLYWAKGIGYNQKKVSTDLTYSYTKETEKLWLYAVYRNTKATASKATFYNANGDILGTAEVADGAVTTLSLDKVSLPGYGAANGWKLAGDDTVYEANTSVSVTGDALFVASYEEVNNTIGISVEDDVTMVVEDGKKAASYGDKVTVTAPLRRDNTKLFNYWKKGNEIVSFDREYSFCAWEACTLTAVYSDYVPLADTVRKIILGTAATNGETTVVAEFIGFDDAVERGIAFGITGSPASYQSINRVVMNRKDTNHLAAIDDIGEGYVGYAIDKDGNVYYSK